jgi:hypothetical protein
MVDFDNEATISTPSTEIVRVLILQSRQYCLEAYEDYLKKEMRGGGDIGVVRARLWTWWMSIAPMYKRRYGEAEHQKIKTIMASSEEGDVLSIIEKLNEELDTIQLTKIDLKKPYDKTKIEDENEAYDL